MCERRLFSGLISGPRSMQLGIERPPPQSGAKNIRRINCTHLEKEEERKEREKRKEGSRTDHAHTTTQVLPIPSLLLHTTILMMMKMMSALTKSWGRIWES